MGKFLTITSGKDYVWSMEFAFDAINMNNTEKSLFEEYLQRFLHSKSPAVKTVKVVLALVAIGAIVGAGAIAPNAVQLFGQARGAGRKELEERKKEYTHLMQKYLRYLARRGTIESISQKDGREVVRITQKGVMRLREFLLDDMVLAIPKKWDGKWRMVIFDIPNSKGNARKALRGKLKELGFTQFQKSIWVFPYPCLDEVLYVANCFDILRFVELATVEELLNDAPLRKHFNLL